MNKIYSKYKKIINLLLLLIIYIVPAVIITLYAIKRLDINFFLGMIILIFFWGRMLHISIIKMIKTDKQYLCFFWIVVFAFFWIFPILVTIAGIGPVPPAHDISSHLIISVFIGSFLRVGLSGVMFLPRFIIILCVGYIIIGLYKYYFYKEKKHLIIAIVSFLTALMIIIIIIMISIYLPPLM